MPFYENVFIARQDVTAAQVEALTEQFAGIVTAQGGNVTKREYWGLKSLSYRVRKNRKGHYTLLNIDGPAAAVIEMERNMRLHEDVLRQLTVRVDALEEAPPPCCRARAATATIADRAAIAIVTVARAATVTTVRAVKAATASAPIVGRASKQHLHLPALKETPNERRS
jgi:ribosomal protein S6